jgi:hypothetical protein
VEIANPGGRYFDPAHSFETYVKMITAICRMQAKRITGSEHRHYIDFTVPFLSPSSTSVPATLPSWKETGRYRSMFIDILQLY